MADLSILAGATSQSLNLFIQSTLLGNGGGLTGLVFNTSGLTAYYTFTGANTTAVSITLATLAAVTTAYSSGGFKEIDATNMPGWYRLDIPNTALATAKGRVMNLHLQGAANMAPKIATIELTAVDNQSTSYGLTLAKTTNITGFNDITAAAVATGVWQDATAGDFTTAGSIGKSLFTSGNVPGAAGGLFIAGTNAATTITTALTTTFTGNLTGSVGSVTGAVGSVTGAVGSVTGNVGGNIVGSVASVTSRVTANTDQLAGQTVTAAAGVTFPTSVASPTNITAGVITTVTNLTNSPTNGDLTATMKTSVTTAATAATPTAAAVTGNVGGNVTGSVGSIASGGITAASIAATALNGKGDWYNNLRKNVAFTSYAFLMQSSTTGAGAPGLTVSGTISKDGGAFAALTNAITAVANGIYQVDLTAGELNANNIILRFTATGASDSFNKIVTQP